MNAILALFELTTVQLTTFTTIGFMSILVLAGSQYEIESKSTNKHSKTIRNISLGVTLTCVILAVLPLAIAYTATVPEQTCFIREAQWSGTNPKENVKKLKNQLMVYNKNINLAETMGAKNITELKVQKNAISTMLERNQLLIENKKDLEYMVLSNRDDTYTVISEERDVIIDYNFLEGYGENKTYNVKFQKCSNKVAQVAQEIWWIADSPN